MTSYSIDRKEIRKFGLIAFLFFGMLFGIAFFRHRIIPLYFFGVLMALGAAFRLSERLSLQNEISADLGSLEGTGLLGLSGNAAFRYRF